MPGSESILLARFVSYTTRGRCCRTAWPYAATEDRPSYTKRRFLELLPPAVCIPCRRVPCPTVLFTSFFWHCFVLSGIFCGRQEPHLSDTLVRQPCKALLEEALVRLSSEALFEDALVWDSHLRSMRPSCGNLFPMKHARSIALAPPQRVEHPCARKEKDKTCFNTASGTSPNAVANPPRPMMYSPATHSVFDSFR